MKKNISALAVLFYILIVPITQASPVAGFTLESHFDSFCVNQGCTKDEATGKWESDISEDCEKYCGKHRLGCLSSGKPQLSDLFSGDKKGGGCETSANREPLAKEAMPTISPEIIEMSKPCSEAGCRCEALYPHECRLNRFCYLRDDQSCETLFGYGVEVEDVFHVPLLSYLPNITQGGKQLELGINFSRDTANNSTKITLIGKAKAKVKEPGRLHRVEYHGPREVAFSTCKGQRKLTGRGTILLGVACKTLNVIFILINMNVMQRARIASGRNQRDA